MNATTEIMGRIQSGAVVPGGRVAEWIGSGDLETWGAVYELILRAHDRIEPEMSLGEACGFVCRYLLRCLEEDPAPDDFVHGGYQAAWDLAAWLKHLDGLGPDAEEIQEDLAADVEALYRRGNESVRDRILSGFLEHAFERRSLRRLFAEWKSDPALGRAYELALEWGEAHPEKVGDEGEVHP